MRPAETLLRTDAWKGEPAFVIGGGPSLRDFPWDRIACHRTIGVNVAFVHEPDIVYAGDGRFLSRYLGDPRWRTCSSLKVIHRSILEQKWKYLKEVGGDAFRGCCYVNVTRHGVWGESVSQGCCAGNNSGLIALNLATILGAEPIYLLGYDLSGDAETQLTCHWHKEYPKQWETNVDTYRSFRRAFYELVPQTFRSGRVKVLEPSRLEIFPKVSRDEALEEADRLASPKRPLPHLEEAAP